MGMMMILYKNKQSEMATDGSGAPLRQNILLGGPEVVPP